MPQRPVDFIDEKRIGREHSTLAIAEFISAYVRGEIPDYQASAWLMAVCLNGLTLSETLALTDAIIVSGDTLDLSHISTPTIDKHSTGGIGDKVTLAVAPIWVAAGLTVAKMSGRGLGYTGGTIDKLESIPGFCVNQSPSDILANLSKVGACLCSQHDSLAPADRLLYSLRDVTATVESMPLIASSIMGKKIASGADNIIIDIKCGSGAFMKTHDQAAELAELLKSIGNAYGRRVDTIISDMDSPLGRTVGNWIEVMEAVNLLRDPAQADPRFRDEVKRIAGLGLTMTGNNDADRTVDTILSTGAAWNK